MALTITLPSFTFPSRQGERRAQDQNFSPLKSSQVSLQIHFFLSSHLLHFSLSFKSLFSLFSNFPVFSALFEHPSSLRHCRSARPCLVKGRLGNEISPFFSSPQALQRPPRSWTPSSHSPSSSSPLLQPFSPPSMCLAACTQACKHCCCFAPLPCSSPCPPGPHIT